jgi:excisionase family DNA binding protein
MTLWDAKQVSEYLQVKPGTVRAWTCCGIIPHVKLGPGAKGLVRYSKDEVDRWIRSNLRRERRIVKRQKARPLVSESRGQ